MLACIHYLQKYKHVVVPISLFCIWAVIQAFLYARFGVVLFDDSPRYLLYAEHLLEGNAPIINHNFWYLGYIVFVALVMFIGGGTTGIVAVQVALSGIAAICLYQISYSLAKQRYVAYFVVLIYILCIKLHWWNFYVLTESFFVSMSIIGFRACLQFSRLDWRMLYLIPLFVWIAWIRPTGFVVMVALLTYILYHYYNAYPKQTKRLLAIALPIVTVVTILFLNRVLFTFKLIQPYVEGQVICGYYDWVVTQEASFHLPPKNYTPLHQIVYFTWYNTSYMLQLCATKLFAYLGNIRPDYSMAHKIAVICFLYPLYILSLFAYYKRPISGALCYMMTAIIVYCIIAMCTCANWNGRFLMPVLPYVFILAGLGLQTIMGLLFSYNKLN